MRIETATADTGNATIGSYRNHLDETKRGLAKLLARENISVRHQNVDTAYFDVENRVLVLPKFDNVTVDQYDLLIGHEVGHAKYSSGPDAIEILKKCHKFNGLHTYLNVIEDCRIERLMKDEYPGLRASFRRGYADFATYGPLFKETAHENLASYSFIDRINIQYKVGAHRDVPFTDAERALFPRIDSLDSMAAAFELAKELYDADVEEQKNNPPSDQGESQEDNGQDAQDSDCTGDGSGKSSDKEQDDGQGIEPGLDGEESQQDGEGDSPTQDGQDSQDSPQDGDSQDSNGNGDSKTGDAKDGEDGDGSEDGQAAPVTGSSTSRGPVAKTDIANEEALEGLTNTEPEHHSAPIEVDLRPLTAKQVAKFEVPFHADVQDYFDVYPIAKAAAQEYLDKFTQKHGATVKYMAREFDLRKTAKLAERGKTSRTGRLDVSKLYAYKFREDLFKSVTVLPNGKSHGVVVIIDGSGSMNDIISDALDQALLFGTFAKAVGIPFKAVVFSTERYSSDTSPAVHKSTDAGSATLTPCSGHLQLMTVLDTTAPKWKDQLVACAGFAARYENRYGYDLNGLPYTDLGATPLYSTLLVAEQYIASMKTAQRLDKTTLLIVTDGDDSSGLEIEYGDGQKSKNVRKYQALIIRDTVTRKVYQDITHPVWANKGDEYCAKTNAMLKALVSSIQERHDTRVVTIKVLTGRTSRYARQGYDVIGNAKQFARTWDEDFSKETGRFSITGPQARQSMKEHGQVAFPKTDIIGDAAILVAADRLRIKTTDDVETAGMTPAQIKRAFVKHSVGASKNRVFVQTVMPFLA